MSLKQQTLASLAELPEDSSAWSELHEEARVLSAIAKAEADVRAGRLHSLEEVKRRMEEKWTQRRSTSA